MDICCAIVQIINAHYSNEHMQENRALYYELFCCHYVVIYGQTLIGHNLRSGWYF